VAAGLVVSWLGSLGSPSCELEMPADGGRVWGAGETGGLAAGSWAGG
jgi:hypothetical protein